MKLSPTHAGGPALREEATILLQEGPRRPPVAASSCGGVDNCRRRSHRHHHCPASSAAPDKREVRIFDYVGWPGRRSNQQRGSPAGGIGSRERTGPKGFGPAKDHPGSLLRGDSPMREPIGPQTRRAKRRKCSALLARPHANPAALRAGSPRKSADGYQRPRVFATRSGQVGLLRALSRAPDRNARCIRRWRCPSRWGCRRRPGRVGGDGPGVPSIASS